MSNQTNSLRLITAPGANGAQLVSQAAPVKKRRNLKKVRVEAIRNRYMIQQLKQQP